ncbi:RRXRR domain-containing protein [Symplocastrum sp. BBK-W-15]|uniref:RRXRR domain-containing protein n=1 Tax=Limnofasciculus baicalensis BBK-W-15 TaxID=2699891 RepID=A0AAE3KQJ2_9CYAN|nr:RRXRR domain-containing protein [Limnofasciculus baicalensis]MCP2730753.1 RRXRR domain-containing protein [Limnofasciculus baicalensis BBK-W-15]
MSNYVLVLDPNKQPLDPVHPSTARLLLNQQKAAVFRRFPFTIILKVANSNGPTQPIQLKIDPGIKITGMALVQNDKVIWAGELQHRGSQIAV